jgi:RHS repeat-associated protein
MDRLVPYTIPAVQQNTLGNIAYEITNYLGNVNVVISDRKIWTGTPTSAFKACVVSRTDYFPFGMEISSRTTVGTYRFGYNGMEQDPEAKGEGNSYTTEFRQYDPRIGRWLSLDPLMAQFPWQSPYCAFDNNPVLYKDPSGLKSEGGPGDGKKPYHNKLNPAPKNVETTETYDCDKDYEYKLDNGENFKLDPTEGQAKSIKVNDKEYEAKYNTDPDKAGEFLGYYSTDGRDKKFTPKVQYGYAWNYFDSYTSVQISKSLNHWYKNPNKYTYEYADGVQSFHFFKSNYNCFELAYTFVKGLEPNYDDGILSPGVFSSELRSNFDNVKKSDMESGRTIIRMAKNGEITHACVFIDFDINGNIIVYTKNDAQAQPRIMLLKNLIKQRPDYGCPEPAYGDNTPYYNLKWEER